MLPRHLQEMGTHADLILAGGAYAKLVHRQIHRDPSYAQGLAAAQQQAALAEPSTEDPALDPALDPVLDPALEPGPDPAV